MEVRIAPVPFSSGKLSAELDGTAVYSSVPSGANHAFRLLRASTEELVAECVPELGSAKSVSVRDHVPLATIYFPGSMALPWLRLARAQDQIVYAGPSGVIGQGLLGDWKMKAPELGILFSSFGSFFEATLDVSLSPEDLDQAIAVMVYHHYTMS